MHLTGDEFITDKHLRLWIWKLQNDCRPNKDIYFELETSLSTSPARHPPPVGVEFISSCCPGQMAAALSFPSTQDIPRSCFLLALMTTSYSARLNGDLDLILTINYELRRLLRLLEPVHKKSHEAGLCDRCSKNNDQCLLPTQKPYWKQAGSMESVYDLVNTLSKMDIVSTVYSIFVKNKFFREANGLPLREVASEPSPSSPRLTYTLQRGSFKPVHSGLTIQTEIQQSEWISPHNLRGTSTEFSHESPIMNPWGLSQHSLNESPLDMHSGCMRSPGYPYEPCTCVIT
ncbi:hypothetical protein RSAG8_09688, partial [Rhizoctonia solani AG-8 WAC10335]